MNIIFLDIDGVLNSYEFDKYVNDSLGEYPYYLLDQKAIIRLKKIIWETGAYVVLSSSWRISDEAFNRAQEQLKPYRIKIIDKTCQMTAGRGAEILEWVNTHDVDHYVALDDDDYDMTPIKEHLVLTTLAHGLEDKHIQEAIEKMRI